MTGELPSRRPTKASGFGVIALALCSLLWLGLAQPGQAEQAEKGRKAALYILGYQETAVIPDGDLTLDAKLDTGADFSSVNAEDIETFDKDGEAWVRFRIVTNDEDSAAFERKVERVARIKSRTGPAIERPVVILGICVGRVHRMVEVNLADREDFSTPLLIGRDFLEAGILINSAAKNTQQPDCDQGAEE